jgi:hypothetical protein
MPKILLAAIVLALSVVPPGASEVVSGVHSVPTSGPPSSPVVFLGRFCYSATATNTETGHFEVKTTNFGADPLTVLAIVDTEWDLL